MEIDKIIISRPYKLVSIINKNGGKIPILFSQIIVRIDINCMA